MKRIIKIALMALVVAMTLSLFSCATIERIFLGGDPYSFSNITLTQVGATEFRVDFDVNCGKENVDIYLTEGFRRSDSIKPISVLRTVNGNKAHFSFTGNFNLAEDYYLWVVNGNKEAKTSITPPSHFPSITMNGDGSALFEFKYTYDTAWGSFCDPTGKAVYKSSKPVFDESAVLIAKDIDITTESCYIPADMVDPNAYYFSVSTAKEGKAKSISCPVMFFDGLKSQVEGLSSKITNDLKLQIGVEIPESAAIASQVAEKLQLVIKTNICDEIYAVPAVYSGGVATMEFDLTNLLFDGLWYDLVFTWDGAYVMDVPQYFGENKIESTATVKKNGVIYSTVGWKPDSDPVGTEILKVYFEEDTTKYADEICKSYLVTFSVGNPSTLTVVADFKDGLKETPVLAITGGDTVKLASVEGVKNDDGSYTFILPVDSALTAPDKWYDLRFFVGSTPYEMLKDSCITYDSFSGKYNAGARLYEFREWNGFLKLMYSDTGVKE